MGNQFWCDRQLTVRVQGPDGGRTIDVGKPYARIGSHQRAEVILEGPGVPKLGLYLHATKQGIFCTPLGKSPRDTGRNGEVDNQQSAGNNGDAGSNGAERTGHWLSTDRPIILGDYEIYASFTDGEQPQVKGLPRLDEKGSCFAASASHFRAGR